MTTLRTALTVAALCLLGGGYAASQLAFFNGRTGEYARSVDTPALKWLSLFLLISAVLLAFFPEREDSR